MSKSNRRTSPNSAKNYSHKPGIRKSLCQALVLVDVEPLKSQTLKKCKSTQKLIEKHSLILEVHDRKDEPAYQAWATSNFGPAMAEMRSLMQKGDELEDVMNETFFVSQTKNLTYSAAFELVSQRREDSSSVDFRIQFEEQKRKQFEREFDFDDEDEQDDDFDFDSLDDDDSTCKDRNSRFFDPFERQSHRSGPIDKENEMQLKSLFREFAKTLHPDVNKSPTQTDQALWHDVLTAYENHDLHQLMELKAKQGRGTSSQTQQKSYGSILRMYKDLLAKLRQIRSQSAQLKHFPSWKFSEKVSDAKHMGLLFKRHNQEIQGELRILQHSLGELQKEHERQMKVKKKQSTRKTKRHDQSLMEALDTLFDF